MARAPRSAQGSASGVGVDRSRLPPLPPETAARYHLKALLASCEILAAFFPGVRDTLDLLLKVFRASDRLLKAGYTLEQVGNYFESFAEIKCRDDNRPTPLRGIRRPGA